MGGGGTHPPPPRLVPTTHDPRPLDKLLQISFRFVGLRTSSFCQRALTNCMENPGRIQMERLIPVEIFRKKSNTFRGTTFSSFLPKRPKFSVPFQPFVLIASAGLHLEIEKATTLPVFCKWYNSIPFLFSVPKKIPVPFDGNFPPTFPCKW